MSVEITRWIMVVALAATLGCGSKENKAGSATKNFQEIAAAGLARNIAVPDQGGHVLWLYPEGNKAILDAQRKGFDRALADGLSRVDEPLPGDVLMPGISDPLSKTWLQDLVAKHDAVVAIILSDEALTAFTRQAGGTEKLPIYGFLWDDSQRTRTLIRSKKVAGALVVRKDADWMKLPKDGKNDEERLAFRYRYLPEK